MKSAISMLGIGLACLAITQFSEPHSIGDKTAVVTKISAESEN